MSVDAGEVAWLKEGRQVATAADPATEARWGAAALETELLSPLALEPGALAEAARQLGFLAGPHAIEEHPVAGLHVGLIGTVQTIVAAGLGYAAGLDVFVIGAAESEGAKTTTLTVIRRL